MTTFIYRGLLNPPSGVEDGLSLGTLSRHVDAGAADSMTLVIGDLPTINTYTHLAQFHSFVGFSYPEQVANGGFSIGVTLVGAQTNVEVVLTIPRADFTAGGGDDTGPPSGTEGGALWAYWNLDTIAVIEAELEAENSGWTVTAVDDGDATGTWTVTFEIASLAAGAHTLLVRYDSPFITNAGPFLWSYGTGGGVSANYPLVVAGSSTEVIAATGDSENINVASVDCSIQEASISGTVGVATEFTIEYIPRGVSSQTSITVQIDDSVTCSSPTTVANAAGHTIGSWTTPGGGVQWQCVITTASQSVDASTTVKFSTTPSTSGYLEIQTAGVWTYDPYIAGPGEALSAEIAPAFTVDATSGKGVPADSTEWTNCLAAAGIGTGNPSSLWLCQDASGNLAAAIGSFAIENPSGTRTYQQAVSGWTRDAVAFTGTDGRFRSLNAGLPNPSSTSVMWLLLYGHPTTPAAQRTLFVPGVDSSYVQLDITTGNLLKFTVGGANEQTAANALSGVTPIIFQSDRTASATRIYTHNDKLIPTYANMDSDKDVWFGDSINAAPLDGQLLYIALFTGGAAEMTTTQVKTLLQTLGWTVGWSP